MDQIIALRQDVESLTSEVGRLHRAFSRRSLAIILLVFAFLVALLFAFRVQEENQRQIDKNNARWCPLVSLLTVKPGEAKPTTLRGIQIADQAATLAKEFNCPA